MLCQHFESLLAQYAEGTIGPRERSATNEHLERCGSCASFLRDLRSLDGLLTASPAVEPGGNFTDRVMASVIRAPQPRIAVASWSAVVVTYVAFAWITIAAFFVVGGPAARASLGLIFAAIVQIDDLLLMLVAASARLAGTRTHAVVAAMIALLVLDTLAVAAIVAVYGRLRRRARADSVPGS